MVITDEQYRFFKFCMENDNTKSERQRNYFSKAISEYEAEKDENIDIYNFNFVMSDWSFGDYLDFLMIGGLTTMVYNIYF